ncbi:hypothetical protein GWI33_012159, partial [Rhynchophorus ferrugineus]
MVPLSRLIVKSIRYNQTVDNNSKKYFYQLETEEASY